jgi:predicted RNase H-like HicB family nuclease
MTREEALANVREAAEAWLEVEQDKVDRGNLLGQVELITL